MAWPLMRRRTHKRAQIAQGNAYRWQIDQANERATAAERRAAVLLDDLAKARVIRGDFPRRLTVVLDCDDLITHYRPRGDEYQILAQRIVSTLAGFSRDYRGDLRQTETQRALGL